MNNIDGSMKPMSTEKLSHVKPRNRGTQENIDKKILEILIVTFLKKNSTLISHNHLIKHYKMVRQLFIRIYQVIIP